MRLNFSAGEEKWKADIEFLAQKFASSDLTRQACEEECQKYIEDDDHKEANIEFACPLACAGYEQCWICMSFRLRYIEFVCPLACATLNLYVLSLALH